MVSGDIMCYKGSRNKWNLTAIRKSKRDTNSPNPSARIKVLVNWLSFIGTGFSFFSVVQLTYCISKCDPCKI